MDTVAMDTPKHTLPLKSHPSLKEEERSTVPSLGTSIEKEGLVNRLGWKCTLRNVRNFINC